MPDGVFKDNTATDGGGGGGVFDPMSIFGSSGDNTKLVAGGQAMLDSAKGGGFRISEEGADQILRGIRQAYDKVEGLMRKSRVLSQDPQLGGHEYGKTLAAHDRQSADGERGVVPMLEALRDTLTMVEEAVQRAAGQYREAEDNAQAAWKNH